MEPRLDYRKFRPEPLQAMLALEKYIASCGLDHKLVHMLKLRVSQINGCAYCIDMHSLDARAAGETEQRLYALDAWRETPFYTDRERPRWRGWNRSRSSPRPTCRMAVFDEVKAQFSDQEIVDLTFVASTINAWNRLAIPLRSVPGRYRPAKPTA